MKQIIADSGFLRILFDKKHPQHKLVQQVSDSQGAELVIPYVVLTETAYLFRTSGGVPAVIRFLNSLIAARVRYEVVTQEDLIRVREVMEQYATAKLDFVDCCIVAIAERLNITQVCTVDRRDFQIIRKRDDTFLEILP